MAVPHFYQSSEESCGVACLRMLFAALGAARDETTIAARCNLTPLGCTVQDLVTGTQALCLNAVLLPVADEPAAIAALSNDVPFVAMIDLGSLDPSTPMFQWHFVVPLALAQGDVTYHDPADGPDRRVPLADFLSAWATAGYRGVRVWTP
jgi:ABC-type bacteriocin/lantibiotic exporter with double-glycine peptidase domain